MADNTDEERLDSPTIIQSENPPDQVIPTNDKETINQIQETENMEVHHHTGRSFNSLPGAMLNVVHHFISSSSH